MKKEQLQDDEVTIVATNSGGSSSGANFQNSNDFDDFSIVKQDSSKAKDKSGEITVKTATKGLIYRVEVFLNGNLIDAKEVDCKDLTHNADKMRLFEQRYLNEHKNMCEKYFAPASWKRVLRDEGEYEDGGECIITTYLGSDAIKTVVMVDGVEMDVVETSMDESIKNDEKILKAKYTKIHKESVAKNFLIKKFPVNTFLDPLLKKLPFYKKNPMYAFYLFVAIVAFVLWIVSLLVCGRAMKKIVKKTFGTEAALVYKDLQRSFCSKEKERILSLEKRCKNNPRVDECKKACEEGEIDKSICLMATLKSAYEITPKKLELSLSPKSLYITNNDVNDLVFKLKERVVENIDDPIITGDNIISVIGSTELVVRPKEGDKKFEFKLEETFVNSDELNSGKYRGKLIFEVSGVTDKKDAILEVPVEFTIN